MIPKQALMPQPQRGEYSDRKRTLPSRVVKVALRLASLRPGRYVLVIDVPESGDVRHEVATLQERLT